MKRILLLCFYTTFFHYIKTSIDCPKHWISFRSSCYRFSRSPRKTFSEANDFCNAYNSKLLSVNSFDEHFFVTDYLKKTDPQHLKWLTSATMRQNLWFWSHDNKELINFDQLWITHNASKNAQHAVYNFSSTENRWGLTSVDSNELAGYICETNKRDLRFVKLREISIDYGVSVTDPEKIERGPIFEIEPKSQIFDLNERDQSNFVSLRCFAKGYPSPEYKWFKEEYNRTFVVSKWINPLVEKRFTQIDGTLMIYHPKKDTDRGKYHCKASNRYGTVISETVEINFGYIGAFSTYRSEDTASTIWGKAISCDAPQHYPRVTYHWTKNYGFPNFVEQNGRIFVSLDGSLYISSVKESDAGNYTCNVYSTISKTGKTGPVFYLRVEKASVAQKLTFPNSFPKAFPETPLAGQRVMLECVAFGDPVPTYSWSRTGLTTHMPDGASLDSHNRLLIIPEVKVEDSGEYTCTARSGNNVLSRRLSLNVQSKPVFVIPLEDRILASGEQLTWTCEAFGIPDVRYVWWRNGTVLSIKDLSIENQMRYSLKDNMLMISNVVASQDEGMYQCQAYNTLGSTFSTGQLVVRNFKPTFDKFPLGDMYATKEIRFVIPCLPEALPPARFEWLKDDRTISSNRIKKLDNGFLQINPVESSDEGWYTCIASNPLGKAYSKGFLHVFEKPHITEFPRPRLTGHVNDTILLPCDAHVDSVLEIAFVWLHNGVEITEGPKFSRGPKPGYLKISNLTFAESGNYSCMVKTSVDTIYTHTWLDVFGPPSPCGAVLAESLTSSTAVINWSDGADNGGKILSYKIEGRTNHNISWANLGEYHYEYVKTDPRNSRKMVTLNSVLSPWSTYEFRVRAISEFGEGVPSLPSPMYNTLQDRPFKAPSNVGGGGGNTGTLTITWDPLPPSDWNAPTIWYKISYKKEGNFEYEVKSLEKFGNIGMHAVTVGEENYYKRYLVRVQAINPYGEGPISDEVEVYSAENMPQIQPTFVRAYPFNSTSLNVTWDPLELSREKIRGKLIGYRIKYWKVDHFPSSAITALKRGAANHGLIVGLTADTQYYVTVSAYNEVGAGPESERFLARTYKAAPQRPPSNVEVRKVNSNTISVTWRGIDTSANEERIIGYKVRYWEKDQAIPFAKEVYKYLNGDLEVIISDLKPKTAYKLRVLAFSRGGDGKMSSPPYIIPSDFFL